MSQSEHAKAALWAQRLDLNRDRLAELTGYAAVTIWWFWQGRTPPSRGNHKKIADWVWLRFKRACGDVDAEINGRKRGEKFDW